jgi:capsular polysaccharide biosynthesis protein
MELRQYWNVIWKRRWLVLAIVVLSTILSGVMALLAPREYKAETRFTARQDPSPDVLRDNYFTFDRYYNWFGSEFLVDDYTQIVDSDAFAGSTLATLKEDLAAGTLEISATDKLKADVEKLEAKDVRGGMGADRRHRNLRITVTAPTRELAKAISDSAAKVLTDARLKPIRGEYTMQSDKALFSQLDAVTMESIESSSRREITNAIIRVVLGLVAALAIAFLLEYLDTSVRDERDATKVLDLPVLGAIPRI